VEHPLVEESDEDSPPASFVEEHIPNELNENEFVQVSSRKKTANLLQIFMANRPTKEDLETRHIISVANETGMHFTFLFMTLKTEKKKETLKKKKFLDSFFKTRVDKKNLEKKHIIKGKGLGYWLDG
jgi:hypothetical protein